MNTVLQKLKGKLANNLYRAGVLKPTPPATGGLRILIYHGIDTKGRKDINGRFISVAELEAQLQYFRQHFHLVSLSQVYTQNLHPEKLNICITFDDGYKNNYQYALPLLEKYNAPAAIFVTAAGAVGLNCLWPDYLDVGTLLHHQPLVIEGELYQKVKGEYRNAAGIRLKQIAKGKNPAFKQQIINALSATRLEEEEGLRPYWELLSREEIKALAANPLITLGTHGVYHNNLDTDTNAVNELTLSKKWLEDITGAPVTAVAFPDGAYNHLLVQQALNCGYTQLLGVNLHGTDERIFPQLKPRLGINPYISLPYQMACIINNGY